MCDHQRDIVHLAQIMETLCCVFLNLLEFRVSQFAGLLQYFLRDEHLANIMQDRAKTNLLYNRNRKFLNIGMAIAYNATFTE